MTVWMSMLCGWIYEEVKGDPQSGLPPGTRWEDVAEEWRCPDCGSSKDVFNMVMLQTDRNV